MQSRRRVTSWILGVLATLCVIVTAVPADAATKKIVTSNQRPMSVIIKYRSQSAMVRPSQQLSRAIATIGSGTLRAVFPARSAKVQQQALVAQAGLDRIAILPINSTSDATAVAKSIAGFAEIEYAEPNYIYHIEATDTPNDPRIGEQWTLDNIHAKEAWEITRGDSSIHVGFVDTGVDWDHPELVHQFAINKAEDINHNGLFDAWPSTEQHLDANGKLVFGDLDGIDQDGNGYADDVIGYDFVDQEVLNIGDGSTRDPIPEDEFIFAHGTSVAGVIAAEQNNKIGISGIAPGCRVVALRAFDSQGTGESDDIASAIIYAADNNVKIINLSYGDYQPSLLQRDAIRYATEKGCLIFGSSGNTGGVEQHFPSDFDEVVSVGATTNYPSPDIVAPDLTTKGPGLDIVAPGSGILALSHDSSYAVRSGTSYSSPTAAAVAALLWSKRPTLTALEVRSILESSTLDIKPQGFDPVAGNGRIDALNALTYQGSAAVKITNVHTNDGFHLGDTVVVRGHAVATLFDHYTLTYAAGEIPDRTKPSTIWQPVASGSSQVLDNLLGVWDTKGLSVGIYTIRLALFSSDQRSTEERITVRLLGNAPAITSLRVDTVFVKDQRGLLVIASGDQVTTMQLGYQSGAGGFNAKSDDKLTKSHSVLLNPTDVLPGSVLTLTITLKNAAGDSVTSVLTAGVPNEAIPTTGFATKPYALPPGYALDSVLSLPKGDNVVMSTFDGGGSFGALTVFTFNGAANKFTKTESLKDAWLPRAFGNTRGLDAPELLLQGSGSAMLLGARNGNVLGDTLYRSSSSETYWGSNLADINGDGRSEIIGLADILYAKLKLDSQYFEARSWNGATYTSIGQTLNPTSPQFRHRTNQYEEPNTVAADLLGDKKKEIISIDRDADVIASAWSSSASQFLNPVFVAANDGESQGSLVTTGDYNGDGKPDIAFAYHTSFDADTNLEYDANEWTVKVYFNRGNGKFDSVYCEHFANARPISPYYSSINSIRNATGIGGDNLVLSLFPSLYLLEYNAATGGMRPAWMYPVSVSPRGAIAYDFDRNGVREVGFVTGDSIRFFERTVDRTGQLATPGGFTATPIDSNEVDLSWSPVTGAQSYDVLRATTGQNTFDVIATVTSPLFIDRTVSNRTSYFYSVVAKGSGIAASLPAFTVQAFVHAKPHVLSVVQSGGVVKLRVSEPLATGALSGALVLIDNSYPAKTVAIANDTTLVVTLPQEVDSGTHALRIRSLALRDVFNSPLDTATSYVFSISAAASREHSFYILGWGFLGGNKIHVTYSLEPNDSALDVSHYSLSPYGTILHAERDTADIRSVILTLDDKTKIVALGVPFVLCVKNIEAVDGTPLENTEGICAGISLTEATLEHIMVYPNPAKRSDGVLTFARLTAQAEVRVFTLDMHPIITLKTAGPTGGIQWNMQDEQGRFIPTGVYLYSVTGRNDEGNEVPGNASKFVVIRDK